MLFMKKSKYGMITACLLSDTPSGFEEKPDRTSSVCDRLNARLLTGTGSSQNDLPSVGTDGSANAPAGANGEDYRLAV